jgi:hypothetical protein
MARNNPDPAIEHGFGGVANPADWPWKAMTLAGVQPERFERFERFENDFGEEVGGPVVETREESVTRSSFIGLQAATGLVLV